MTMTEKTDKTGTDNSVGNADTGQTGVTPPLLVAVDFSSDSQAALLWADKQANCHSAQIIILHVVHDPAETPGFYRRQQHDNNYLQPMEEIAEDMMKEFLAKTIKNHPDCTNLRSAKTRLVSGLPAGRIIEIAEEEKATMIVIGSRGLSGLPHLLLGSTADRVAQLSHIPVTIVKHPKKAVTNE